MLKKALLLSTLICTCLILFTTSAISSERQSNEKMITSAELQKMAELRNKMIQSNFIKGQSVLKKIPSMLDVTPMVPGLKQYKQSLSQKSTLMEKNKVPIRKDLDLVQ